MSQFPRTWLLLGPRRGDNGQLFALAEALQIPFETRTILYKPSTGLRMKFLRKRLGHATRESRAWLQPPWPDLVIGIGRRSVPLACWIKKQSGGRTRLVRLGHPRADNELFDLVITTPQYPVPPGDNVITLPLAMNRFRKAPPVTEEEQAWLDALPRPHLLLSLGGDSRMWRLDLSALERATEQLADRAKVEEGTLIVVGSPRTPNGAWDAVRGSTKGSKCVALVDSEVRYPVLLADANEHFVTADSVSMISEAVLTRKPVGIIPIEPDELGRGRIAGRDPGETPFRDPRRFWAEVERRGLAGSVAEPRTAIIEDPVETAVAAVRERLSGLFG